MFVIKSWRGLTHRLTPSQDGRVQKLGVRSGRHGCCVYVQLI